MPQFLVTKWPADIEIYRKILILYVDFHLSSRNSIFPWILYGPVKCLWWWILKASDRDRDISLRFRYGHQGYAIYLSPMSVSLSLSEAKSTHLWWESDGKSLIKNLWWTSFNRKLFKCFVFKYGQFKFHIWKHLNLKFFRKSQIRLQWDLYHQSLDHESDDFVSLSL